METYRSPKIALVNPNNRGSYRSNQLMRESLSLGYLASWLIRNNCKVKLYDARLERLESDVIAKYIISFKPDIVGVSLIAKEGSSWAKKLTEHLKGGGFKACMVMGNYFPSLQPKRALDLVPEADYVVSGEGEYTLLDLAQRIVGEKSLKGIKGVYFNDRSGRIQFFGKRELIPNLDLLPFPYRYAKESQISELSIEGSRGCYYNCTFCAIPCNFNADPQFKWRVRSPENIVSEIIQLRKKYPNIDVYRFVDPDFIGCKGKGEKRALEFAKLVIKHKLHIQFYIETKPSNVGDAKLWKVLKKAGLRQVYMGVETGSPKIKEIMDKRSNLSQDEKAIKLLKSLGISTQYGFMMFTPWTTEEDILLNIKFIKKIGYAGLDKFFQEMNLVPGTKALELAKKIGEVYPDGNTGYYSYKLPAAIDRLRKIGRMFEEAKYVHFLERIWFLYKDIQYLNQLGKYKTSVLKNRLRDLNINIFVFCLNSAKRIRSNDVNILSLVIKQCIKKFLPDIELLEKKLDPKVHFPREGGIVE